MVARHAEQAPVVAPVEILVDDARELQVHTKELRAQAVDFLHQLKELDVFFTLTGTQELYLKALCEYGFVTPVIRELLAEGESGQSIHIKLSFFNRYWDSMHPELQHETFSWFFTPDVQDHMRLLLKEKPKGSFAANLRESQLSVWNTFLRDMAQMEPDRAFAYLESLSPQELPLFHSLFPQLARHSLRRVAQLLQLTLTKDDLKHPSWGVWTRCLSRVMGDLHADVAEILSTDNETFLLGYIPQHILPASTLVELNGVDFLQHYDPQSILWLLQNRPKFVRNQWYRFGFAVIQLAKMDGEIRQSLQKTLEGPLYQDDPFFRLHIAYEDLEQGDARYALSLVPELHFGNAVAHELFCELIKGGHVELLTQKLLQELPSLTVGEYDTENLSEPITLLLHRIFDPQRDQVAHAVLQHPSFLVETFSTLIGMGYAAPVWEQLRANNFRYSDSDMGFRHMLHLMRQCVAVDPSLTGKMLEWAKNLDPADESYVRDIITGNLPGLRQDAKEGGELIVKTFLQDWEELIDNLKQANLSTSTRSTRFQSLVPILPLSPVQQAASEYTANLENWVGELQKFWASRSLTELLFLRRFFQDHHFSEIPTIRVRELFRQALNKTGGEARVWSNGIFINQVPTESADIWRQLHEENLPVAPILKMEAHTPETSRVRSRYCGWSVHQLQLISERWPLSLMREIFLQKEAILASLVEKNIDHGHPHDGNFTVEFVQKSYWQQHRHHINTMPYDPQYVSHDPMDFVLQPDKWQVVVRLIDWDQARFYPRLTDTPNADKSVTASSSGAELPFGNT